MTASSTLSRKSSPTVIDLLTAAVGAVPDGIDRPGQRQMAEAVASAAEDGEHLLVQAGTGTGKSLAYLVPSLLVDGPVVVSTATLALQSQLVDHDLPRLADAVTPLLGRRPTFAVLKGRHHYVCLARLEGSGEEEPADALFDADQGRPTRWLGEAGRLGKQIERLRDWALETDTGDRDELDPGVDDSAWRLVSMPARECVGAARCPYGAECFAEASRVRAREADIVVTNHSLLAVDMLAERHIIPPHELLVIDEAHELAERVSSASQAELTPEVIDRAGRRARSYVDSDVVDLITEAGDALVVGLADAEPGRITTGLPPALRDGLTLIDSATRRAVEAIGEVKGDDSDPVRKQQVKTVLGDISRTAQRLLGDNAYDVAWIERDDRGRRAVVVAPLSVAGTLADHLYTERTVVATSATLALGGRFDTVARSLGLPVGPVGPAAATSSAGRAQRVVAAADAARGGETRGGELSGAARRGESSGAARGGESSGGARGGQSAAQPAGSGGGRQSAGARSGSASPQGRGADRVGPVQRRGSEAEAAAGSPAIERHPYADLPWRSLDVGSPFDYAKQGILYVAAHLPKPMASGLPDAAAEELVSLVTALGGRTLGLFSSRKAAERAAEVLRARTSLTILLQGEEALPLLVRRFREDRNSCLFGVMSLWQGVDVPGDACQLVVIDRLPFPRPDEPLAAARSAAVEESGGSGFAAVSVPIAAVRLAQGVGRLIRSRGDKGVVAVLDSRLETARSYGPYLRASLPPFWYTTKPEQARAALGRLAKA